MPVTITLTLSDEHADAIRRGDFDGHQPTDEVTDLTERAATILAGYCDQALLDEAYTRMLLYRRLMARQNENGQPT